MLSSAFATFTLFSTALPFVISEGVARVYQPEAQHFHLTKSFSLLLLGMSLSTLATLNFSLALLVGLLASPLTFVQPSESMALRWSVAGILSAFAPPVVLYSVCQLWTFDVTAVLEGASFGWNIWGMYTPVVVWCVWWPAWMVGMVNALGRPR